MTVRCLSGVDKSSIVFQFSQLGQTVSSLSYEYKKSRRTIIRVLEEHGIDPGVKHRKQAKKVDMPTLSAGVKDYVLSPYKEGEPPKPIPTKTPWYRRFKEWWNTKVVSYSF